MGITTTNSDAHAKTMKMLRDWGQDRKYNHLLEGYNYRMDGIQGACLRVKLRHLEDWTEGRRKVAARYLAALGGDKKFQLPEELPGRRHVWHIYAVRVAQRDRVLEQLRQAGIGAGVHYPVPIHLQGAFAGLGHRRGDFPNAERAADEMISLPIYPGITADQQERVASVLRRAVLLEGGG